MYPPGMLIYLYPLYILFILFSPLGYYIIHPDILCHLYCDNKLFPEYCIEILHDSPGNNNTIVSKFACLFIYTNNLFLAVYGAAESGY